MVQEQRPACTELWLRSLGHAPHHPWRTSTIWLAIGSTKAAGVNYETVISIRTVQLETSHEQNAMRLSSAKGDRSLSWHSWGFAGSLRLEAIELFQGQWVSPVQESREGSTKGRRRRIGFERGRVLVFMAITASPAWKTSYDCLPHGWDLCVWAALWRSSWVWQILGQPVRIQRRKIETQDSAHPDSLPLEKAYRWLTRKGDRG